jgi:hypothetical protein
VSIRADGPRTALAWPGRAGPVLVVAVLLGLLIGSRLLVYHGNATGLIQFGAHSVQYTHPPRGAVVDSPDGYDGQFYWIQANDPLLLHDATVVDLRHTAPGYHLQRVAYPTLAYVLAAGQRSAIPWSLLAVNVLAVLAITAGFAVYARSRGWSDWWALAIGLTPGFVLATMRDLSDPLAIACMLGGLLTWQRGRRWWTAALLTVAVLAREPMTLAVVAIAVDAVVRWWRSRREPGALRRAVRHTWPAVIVPAAGFLVWQVYIQSRYGSGAAATSPPVLPPFKDFVEEARRAIDHDSTLAAAWDLAYLALMLAGLGAALTLLRRGVTTAGVAALLFALNLTVIIFGDQWGDSRYGAPVFAALLLGGLEQRSRLAVWICAAVAAMTIFVPVAIAGA